MAGSSLHQAIKDNDVEAIRTLISQGADVNECESNIAGLTPLHLAVRGGSVEVLKLLLEAGADVSKKDNFGEKPLEYVLEEGSLEFIKIFIDSGADVNSRSSKKGNTALHFAVKHGDRWMIKYLLSRGADVNAKSYKSYLESDQTLEKKRNGPKNSSIHGAKKLKKAKENSNKQSNFSPQSQKVVRITNGQDLINRKTKEVKQIDKLTKKRFEQIISKLRELKKINAAHLKKLESNEDLEEVSASMNRSRLQYAMVEKEIHNIEAAIVNAYKLQGL